MRWTWSDTLGFLLALVITNLPVAAIAWLEYAWSGAKPPYRPRSVDLGRYVCPCLIACGFAVAGSLAAWRFGGTSARRWAIHVTVALVMLVMLIILVLGFIVLWTP